MIVYHSHSILASICKLKNKAKAAPIKAAPIKAKCSKTKHKRGKNLKQQTSSLRQKFMKLLSHSEFKDDGVSNTSLLAHFG